MYKKDLIAIHSALLAKLYNILCLNKKTISGTGNIIYEQSVFMKHCRFNIRGNNNKVILLKQTGGGYFYNRLKNCYFSILGSNNVIVIGPNSTLQGVSFCMEKDNNKILIGKNFDCHGNTEFSTLEGTKIIIGDDALFSANIKFRTGDSHSILDVVTGVRTNHSKDIILGNHVWVGNSVCVLKGANIGADSIVGIGSVVPGKTYPTNSIIGGNPAKVIKGNVNWCFEQV